MQTFVSQECKKFFYSSFLRPTFRYWYWYGWNKVENEEKGGRRLVKKECEKAKSKK